VCARPFALPCTTPYAPTLTPTPTPRRSRNAENNTGKYPDIVARLPLQLKPGVKSIVLDSEAVAWDKETKKILPFQVGGGW
jgi:hypothetical protein